MLGTVLQTSSENLTLESFKIFPLPKGLELGSLKVWYWQMSGFDRIWSWPGKGLLPISTVYLQG